MFLGSGGKTQCKHPGLISSPTKKRGQITLAIGVCLYVNLKNKKECLEYLSTKSQAGDLEPIC